MKLRFVAVRDRMNLITDSARIKKSRGLPATDEHYYGLVFLPPCQCKNYLAPPREWRPLSCATFTALFVETPGFGPMNEADKKRCSRTFILHSSWAPQLKQLMETTLPFKLQNLHVFPAYRKLLLEEARLLNGACLASQR